MEEGEKNGNGREARKKSNDISQHSGHMIEGMGRGVAAIPEG